MGAICSVKTASSFELQASSFKPQAKKQYAHGLSLVACRLQLAHLNAQIVQNPFSRIAAFEDCGHNEIRSAHHIATGEDFRVAGLVLELALFRRDHTALAVGVDLVLLEPGCRAWAETEGDDHSVCRDDLFGAWNRLGAATTTGIRLAKSGLDDLHAFDLVLTHNGDRLAVVEELHALFLGVLHFLARARHVFFVAAIGT